MISCNTIKLTQQLYTNSEFIAFHTNTASCHKYSLVFEKNEGDCDLNCIPTDCQFSKFLKCYPLKDRTAQSLGKSLFDYCLTSRILLKLYSDRDPVLEVELFQLLLMQQFGVKKLWTSGYQLQANGLTEQSKITINNNVSANTLQQRI